jgi:hypothetical protein
MECNELVKEMGSAAHPSALPSGEESGYGMYGLNEGNPKMMVHTQLNARTEPGRIAFILGIMVLSPFLSSCLGPSGGNARNLLADGQKTTVLEGQVTVTDGQVTPVKYKKPFLSPPKLQIMEIAQSWSRETPYRMSDFKVVSEQADLFRVENDHHEQYWGSYAVLKWRAEGIPAPDKKAAKPPDSSSQK